MEKRSINSVFNVLRTLLSYLKIFLSSYSSHTKLDGLWGAMDFWQQHKVMESLNTWNIRCSQPFEQESNNNTIFS